MGMDGKMGCEGLKDVTSNVFQLYVSKVDPVRDKVHLSVKFAEISRIEVRGEDRRSIRHIAQTLFEELLERLAAQSIM